MSKKVFLWVAAIVIIVVLIVITGEKESSTKEKEVIKIGSILPLSGNLARIAETERRGIEMAVEDINKEGGINGKLVEVVYEDSEAKSNKAIDGYRKIRLDDSINIIIPTISSICQALSPIANGDQVVLMASDCAVAGYSSPDDYTFRILSSNKKEGEQMAEYLISKDIKSIAVLKVNNDYGEGLLNSFSNKYEELGGEIFSQSYNSEERDFGIYLTKIRNNKDLQAIYLMSYPPDLIMILKKVKEFGINLPMYSGEPIEANDILEEASEEAKGVVYLRSVINNQDFINRYQEKYSEYPELYPARSFDAMNVVAEVIKICDKNNNLSSGCIKDELYKIKDYQGVMGIISFDRNGDVDIPYQVKIIKNGEFVEYNE